MNFSKLRNSEFIGNVLKIAGGSAGAQIITLAFTPIITRLFSPEDYGLLGAFTALLVIFIPVAALTYPIAIVLPKENSEAIKIASLSYLASLVVFVIFSVLLLLIQKPLLELFDLELLGNFVYLIPLIMLFSGFQQINQQLLIHNSNYGFIGKVSVLQALLINIGKTVAGISFPTGGGLIIITTVGHLLHGLMLAKEVKKELAYCFKKLASIENYKEIVCIAKKYVNFPKFRAPQTMVHALSQSIPILIFGAYFGVVELGLYVLSKSIIHAPVSLIGKSINDVFYPKAARMFNDGERIDLLLIKSTLTLLIIGLPPLAAMFIWGESLFGWVFGGEWRSGGIYASWLSLWMLSYLVTRPIISIIPIFEMQGWFFKNELINLVIRVAAFYFVCNYFNNPAGAIAIFSILNMLIYMYIFLYVYRNAFKILECIER